MDSTLEKMIKAAHAGGEVLKKYFGQTLDLTQKTIIGNWQTKADLESEKAILKILSVEFPGYNVHAEEEGHTNNNHESTFYVDPLDGTSNFILGIPNFSVSIGLVKDNQILAGVIYLPILDQIFYAENGKGAFLNTLRLQVNKESDIHRATISYAPNYDVPKERTRAIHRQLIEQNYQRRLSSWATAGDLCLLASGKIEAVIMEQAEIYDFAAGKLIAKEAGAKVTDFNSQPEANDLNDNFIVSNGQAIHQNLVEIFKR